MSFITKERANLLLCYSLGVIFVWFGILKVFNISPVATLIAQVSPLSFSFQLPLLGIFEILLGISFFMKRITKVGAIVTFLYLLVITPLTLFGKGFNGWFPVLSFTGEFVIKNIVLMAGCLVLLARDLEKPQQQDD